MDGTGPAAASPFVEEHERLVLPDAPADHAPRLDEPLVHVVHAAAINDMVCVYLTMYKWSASITCRKPSTRLPALTTIDPHIDDYAKHAVDMLIDRIEGYSGPARTYTTDFTLVERASTRLAH